MLLLRGRQDRGCSLLVLDLNVLWQLIGERDWDKKCSGKQFHAVQRVTIVAYTCILWHSGQHSTAVRDGLKLPKRAMLEGYLEHVLLCWEYNLFYFFKGSEEVGARRG